MNREILEKEFEPSQIKKRRGPNGELDYVETADVIRRLNASFDGEWSFEIVEYREMFDEVVVLGKLTAEGIVKSQFGSHKITKAKKDGEVVNIGSGTEISIGDTFNLIKDLMQSDVTFITEENRLRPKNSEVYRLCCDNTKIQTLTGFTPRYTLKDGLQKCIVWFTQIENLSRYKIDIYNV